MLKKLLVGLVGLVLLVVVGAWVWWPENLVVKGPVLDSLTGRQVEAPAEKSLSGRFELPVGFRMGVFAKDVPHARMMRVTATGDLLVTSMRDGNVILLHRDQNGDGKADGRTMLFHGLNVPHGLALHEGYVYVAETSRILRARFNPETRITGALELVFDGLPSGGNHRTRTIGFGPDNMLYVTVGSSCNVCIEEHPYRAAMLRMNADGSDAAIYATGLRNTVGFDWRPGTGALYGTDNGRDLLGDDTPNCELNLIENGADYGWPYAYDNQVPDPEFGADNKDKISRSEPMAHGFGAHRAPLGIRFLDPKLAPDGYDDAALVALHGSWNRSTLAGYKVVSLHFDGTDIAQKDFLTGFERDEDVVGRPVDIAQGPDGAIYVSDDYAGVIYRIGFDDIAVAKEVNPGDERSSPLAGLRREDITLSSNAGAQLFEKNDCASCHTPGRAPENIQVKVLKNLGARYTVESLAALLQTPPSPMPSFDFTPEQRINLAVFLMSEDFSQPMGTPLP
ncbi:PQQ-dependent sugar dehydrogenase [Kordiimonas aestuarii]|uniref:PQQ-dependent sugar dehydrogenase n=1 Tax=Kordiimonas aestuarii TaxID=1005925 RepID=UPI0021CF3AA6|nr:PQQ-dependent sugar dehydrogenase [Kordiimonas aestuarii]